MDKVLKNVSTLLLEVQATLVSLKNYKDMDKVYRAFLEKVEKVLLKEPKNDLMASFEAMHEMIEAQELSHQQKHIHHMSAIIVIQTIIKLGEGQDILAKKNALGQVLKTYISQKIQSLCMSENEQFKNCLLLLAYFTVGFNCWRKCRDHVPELYAGLKYLLHFIQKNLIPLISVGSEKKSIKLQQENSSNERHKTIKYDDLFESVIIRNEKTLSQDSLMAFLRITLAFLNNSFKITNMETNFDFLYQPLLYQLNDLFENADTIPSGLREYLKQTTEKTAEWINDFSHKSDLDILIEKPLIKIKQLDPRIIEKGQELNKFIEKSKLKKKVKNATKKIVREIKSDQAVMDRKKLEDYERNLKEKDQARKKFVTIMDNQALEIKRIKTTQINFDRNKKKKTRTAGNKTQ